MKTFSGITVSATDEAGKKAAEIFLSEVADRTDFPYAGSADAAVVFSLDDSLPDKDSYRIAALPEGFEFSAKGVRGLVYALFHFLRKCEFRGGEMTLTEDIEGTYTPFMKIRGHQCGYRPLTNTYDAWSPEDYRRFYLAIMAFGSNTCEHIPGGETSGQNSLMKYSPLEMAGIASGLADELDLDVSCWYPNSGDEENDSALALERRRKVFEKIPRIDAVFPPGGDPGDMDARAFIDRCIEISSLLKKIHPHAEMWPSAQAPHSKPGWGEEFISAMEKLPDEIDGIIMGPNHAFPLEELRRRLPEKYPIRFYPDITHNLRCEYPVHFDKNDWHFSLATGLSRESVNPRPMELKKLHGLTRQYVTGSVSYSEGVNDDVNKAVWGALDFDPDTPVKEILEDYSRLFMWQADADKISDGILGLEKNWEGAPENNPGIENTLALFEEQLEKAPSLKDNWRFVMLIFRARCDMLIKSRRVFELSLIKKAKGQLLCGDFSRAKETLMTDFSAEYYSLREKIASDADTLFDLIGIQLDCENYFADGWERGATLDTIDLPVTDRAWLLDRLDFSEGYSESERKEYFRRIFDRTKKTKGEFYWSYALDGLDALGEEQTGEYYLNFQGDRPNVNNGQLPTCLFSAYDHYSFVLHAGGFLPEKDRRLRVTYKEKSGRTTDSFRISANGKEIYRGDYFGGEKDEKYDREMLAPGFVSAVYVLPAEVFEKGCVRLEILEDKYGMEICEIRII